MSKIIQKLITITTLTLFLAGCTSDAAGTLASTTTGGSVNPRPTATTDPLTSLERARAALTAYLDALSQQDYERAAQFFGGDLDVLRGYNPFHDSTDVPGLLEKGCEMNGLMCLPPLKILKEEAHSENRFAFTLQLVTRNGELFEIGACCGADPEDVVPVSEFVFEVEQRGKEFKVLTLPPYVP